MYASTGDDWHLRPQFWSQSRARTKIVQENQFMQHCQFMQIQWQDIPNTEAELPYKFQYDG